jgi:biopolymer transport protein ExbD
MSNVLHKKEKFQIQQDDAELDLVPMIDMVFLILLFFMLCGRITMDQRTEQITVPPTRTATVPKDPKDYERIVINVFGSTKSGKPPRNTIRIDGKNYVSTGPENLEGYQKLRQVLDIAYDRADKYEDPKKSGMMLPKIVLEIRADADTEYRVVQEVQQVVSDSINPYDGMKSKVITDPKQAKPFVFLNFTTRRPEDN